MKNDQLIDSVLSFVEKKATYKTEILTLETEIGEHLRLLGDDAQEFLEEFSRVFHVDLSQMNFSDYFPDEASSDMHYYLLSFVKNRNSNPALRVVRGVESKLWKIFAKKTTYKKIRIADLVAAVKSGSWSES